jgi:phage shock protein E
LYRLGFVLICIVALAAGCTGKPHHEASRGKTLEQQAWERIRAGALVVDVRTPREFDKGHLEGAILIPHTQISARLDELGSDLDRNIVVYCRSGRRSGIAQQMLRGLGYKNVLNGGGFEALKAAKKSEG